MTRFSVWILIHADLPVMETRSGDVTHSPAIGVVFSNDWSLAVDLHNVALKHRTIWASCNLRVRKHWVCFYKPFRYYDHTVLKPIYLHQHVLKRMQYYLINFFQKRHTQYKTNRGYDVNGLYCLSCQIVTIAAVSEPGLGPLYTLISFICLSKHSIHYSYNCSV
jgi:hypothetical protein